MKLFALAKQKVVTFLQKAQEGDMSRIECPICTQGVDVSMGGLGPDKEFEFLGLITCFSKINKEERMHSFPFKFIAGGIRGHDIGIMPEPRSVNALTATVKSAKGMMVQIALIERNDLVQDITEACDAKKWGLYKSSVVMCRRIVQIPLAESLRSLEKDDVESAIKQVNKKWGRNDLDNLTLGPLLAIERNLESHLLTNYQYEQADRIREAGNDGAHNEVELDPDSVDGNIREAAIIAASLVFKMDNMEKPLPESQLEKGSNER